MKPLSPLLRAVRIGGAGLALLLASGCGGLLPQATPTPAFYALDGEPAPAAASGARSLTPRLPAPGGPTLIVLPPHAAAGYDSQHLLYTRQAHELAYFAHSEWVDTPARMLAPLLVAALQNTGAFRAVALTPSAMAGELTLDAEILRLQQDFNGPPSQVRFTLRAYLVDSRTRQLLAWREFDLRVAAESEDPYGGVKAANLAVRAVLEQLAALSAEAVGPWQAARAAAPGPAGSGAPRR